MAKAPRSVARAWACRGYWKITGSRSFGSLERARDLAFQPSDFCQPLGVCPKQSIRHWFACGPIRCASLQICAECVSRSSVQIDQPQRARLTGLSRLLLDVDGQHVLGAPAEHVDAGFAHVIAI